jgi:phosphopantetheinyl transferase (holo-ACP synthase)
MKESLSLRRQGKIDAEEYAWRKRLVIQQQKRANEREREEAEQRARQAEQRARQAAFLAKEAARKAARAEAYQRKSLATRTFVLTQNYGKETMVLRKNGYESIRVSPLNDLTKTETIIRNIGEGLKAFEMRARRRGEELVEEAQTSYDEAGDTRVIYHAGDFSLHQGDTAAAQGMRKPRPWAYENSGFYSLVDEGRCVPKTLHKQYPRKRYALIVSQLFPDGDDLQPCLAEWVLKWCVRNDITVIGTDEHYTILKGEETGVDIEYYSKNRNYPPLYFVQKDNHMYIMDKERGLAIANNRKNSRKEAKEEVKTPQKTIYLDEGVVIDYEAENIEYISPTRTKVKELFIEYLSRFHSIPKIQMGVSSQNAIYLKTFSWGKNMTIRYEPHYKLAMKVAEKTGSTLSIRELTEYYQEQVLTCVPKSFMNNDIMAIFLRWPQRQHFAHLYQPEWWYDEMLGNRIEQCIDQNKQYTSILRNPPHPWILLDMMSLPRPYSGTITDALYFIKTENMMPAKGNGLYSRVMVEYLQSINEPFEILYEISGKVLPRNFFTAFVDKVMKEVPDGYKHIINTACGLLNTHKKKRATVHTTPVKAVCIERCLTKGDSMTEYKVGDEIIYCSARISEELLYENNMPMYSQILDTSAVIIHKKIKELESFGAIIRSYNTDSITFAAKNVYELPPNQPILGGWKTEAVKEYSDICKRLPNKDTYTAHSYTWMRDVKDTEVNPLEVLKGGSWFIEGAAGFGKTTLIEEFIKQEGEEKFVVAAYTNIAANNIGGTTLNKLFKIKLGECKGALTVKYVMGEATHLIGDEASQTPANLYKIFEEAKRADKKVIILGDLQQILPVGETRDCLPILKMLCENRLTLTQYRRGDAEMLAALTEVRERRSVPFDKVEKGILHFCFTKKKRDELNEREISKVKKGYWCLPKNDSLERIFVGMYLRSTRTSDDGCLLNGERWVIQSITQEEVHISSMIRNMKMMIPFDKIQKDFVPGFAMTIHSSQGLTISEPYTVHIEASLFSKDDYWRMIYTAVSRAKTKSQVGVVYHS